MCWAFALFTCALWIIVTLQIVNNAYRDRAGPNSLRTTIGVIAALIAYMFVGAAFVVLLISLLDLSSTNVGGSASLSAGASPKPPAILAIVVRMNSNIQNIFSNMITPSL